MAEQKNTTIPFHDFTEKKLFDAEIKLNNNKYYASAFILSEHSDVFNNMLSKTLFQESNDHKLILSDIDTETLLFFLEFSHYNNTLFFDEPQCTDPKIAIKKISYSPDHKYYSTKLLLKLHTFANKYSCNKLMNYIQTEFNKIAHYSENDDNIYTQKIKDQMLGTDKWNDYINPWIFPDGVRIFEKQEKYKGEKYWDCYCECLEYFCDHNLTELLNKFVIFYLIWLCRYDIGTEIDIIYKFLATKCSNLLDLLRIDYDDPDEIVDEKTNNYIVLCPEVKYLDQFSDYIYGRSGEIIDDIRNGTHNQTK